MNAANSVQRVGIVGLGIMGSAMATRLLAAGYEVVGCDLVPEKVQRLVALGGTAASTPAEVAAAGEIVITSVASAAAAIEVAGGTDGLVAGAHQGLVVVDTSTLPLQTKEHVRQTMEGVGVVVLDCTLSGTGAQAARGDLAVYASGPEREFDRCRPPLEAMSRSVRYLGAFGAGSKMKFIANLLVAIHNVATAEALVLGRRAGLDPQQVFDVIADGAGTSRMFEVRGPLMVSGSYDDPSARMDLFLKDVEIIDSFARSVYAPVPMFSAAMPFYAAAMAQGREGQDPAAVHEVLADLAALE